MNERSKQTNKLFLLLLLLPLLCCCALLVICSDSVRAFGAAIKQQVTEELVQHIVSKAKESGIPKSINTAEWMYSHYTRAA